jgi:hypothetical protein
MDMVPAPPPHGHLGAHKSYYFSQPATTRFAQSEQAFVLDNDNDHECHRDGAKSSQFRFTLTISDLQKLSWLSFGTASILGATY